MGVVTAVQENGRTEYGDIPDHLMTVRGNSGNLLTVSLVESHMQPKEPPADPEDCYDIGAL